MRQIYKITIASISLFLIISTALLAESDCQERVVIDSIEYQLSDSWCGLQIDSQDIAIPAELVQLPQELTFEEYRIYLRPEVRDAMVIMAEEAKKDSIFLIADSGFRSLSFQRRIFKRRLAKGDSFNRILKSVAPPGYSEHHSGRCIDLVPSEAIFANTKTYEWLKANAYKFGFIETYSNDPDSKLPWEAWHWSYIGGN